MTETFTHEELVALKPYVSNTERPVFVVQNLPEEVVAVLFAYYSRSKESLRRNLLKLLVDKDLDMTTQVVVEEDDGEKLSLAKEKAKQFHEKWVVGYGHACYDEATDVLTEDGWCAWKEVAASWNQGKPFRLASLNPETGFLEYLSPTKIIAEPHVGPMYRVSSKSVDLCVTPNHKMWVCTTRTREGRKKQHYELIEAKDLDGVPCAYQLSAKWQGSEPETIYLGEREVKARALLKFTGFFIGDGYHDVRYHDAVQFHIRKPRKIEFLKQVCAQCGFEIAEHKNDKYYVKHAELGDFLQQCYDEQGRKIIPKHILSYSTNLLHGLMEGLVNSDGHEDDGGHLLYSTTSKPLQEQFYELALKLGWAAFINPPDSSTKVYTIHLNRTRLKPEVNKVAYRKQDTWDDYKGMVYCAELPRHHTLYVRRNGRAVWSGNSVAEHAIAHIAIEDVSIVTSKIIEDNRLASYTEKSTRYVVFDEEKYYKAPELAGTAYAELYRETVSAMMKAYAKLTPQCIEEIKKRVPKKETQTNAGYNTACKAKACDILRYILPAATFTNIGLTINGRALEHMITKMLSHPLREAREFGASLKREAETIIPTLLKYADYNAFIDETNREMQLMVSDLMKAKDPGSTTEATPTANRATLVHYDEQAEDKLIAAILYEYSQTDLATVNARVSEMSREAKEQVIDEYLKRRGKWDEPLRALEQVYYTFDILVDYGAFRDIQRHRMATQTNQLLTNAHGFETPPEINEYGYAKIYTELVERGSLAFEKISKDFPYVAQYALPLAFRKRAMFTWNLRSLNHFISLRSARQGHISYRDIAQQVYREIARVHPLLAKYIRVDLQEYALARA
ncbi:MAG: FAD-dependent thymidylate synthase [Acidobacteriota bacterium]